MSKIQVKKRHTFFGHKDCCYSLEAYNDRRFFSSGADGLVVLWDAMAPYAAEVIARVGGSVYAMACDQSSDTLYVAENNERIYKIDLKQKKEIGSVSMGNYKFFDLKYKKGKLWSLLESGELVVLNEELQVIRRQKLASERLRSIDFYNNDMAIGASDNKVKILSAHSLRLIHELSAHKNSVFTAMYHPSGKYLVSGGRDAQLKVWDTMENYLFRESIAAHLHTINHLTFSHDGKYFATCSMDKSIKLWNAHNLQLLKVVDKHRYAGHNYSVNKLLWMKYKDLLVSCSDDRTISIWEITLEK